MLDFSVTDAGTGGGGFQRDGVDGVAAPARVNPYLDVFRCGGSGGHWSENGMGEEREIVFGGLKW